MSNKNKTIALASLIAAGAGVAGYRSPRAAFSSVNRRKTAGREWNTIPQYRAWKIREKQQRYLLY